MVYETEEAIRASVQQFVQERKYLTNVSPKTLLFYQCSFRAFEGSLRTAEAIKARIVDLRARGLNPISINTYLTCIQAYCTWRGEAVRFPHLKTEQKVLNTFSPEQVGRLVRFKPKGRNLTRAHAVACLLLDTGLRISEALNLAKSDIDLDNLVIRALGKGNKQRLVPFSLELRRRLWLYLKGVSGPLAFPTRSGLKVTVRNFQRDSKLLGEAVHITGIRMSPHTCRHTFAYEYLRRGGNLEYLRRILGHSSILTTQKHLRSLGVADLQAAHEGLSPLTAERGRMEAGMR